MPFNLDLCALVLFVIIVHLLDLIFGLSPTRIAFELCSNDVFNRYKMAPAPKFSVQEQEGMILDAAVQSIEESSILDFTMSQIAKSAGLSMGSVYKHVQSKEDVLIALATGMYENEYARYKAILSMPVSAPEKIIGINLMHRWKTDTYSFESQLDNLVTTQALVERCSAGWLARMRNQCSQIESLFKLFLTEAADSGEFISGHEAIEELNLAVWSFTTGYFHVVRQYQCHVQDKAEQPNPHLCQSSEIGDDALHIRGLVRLLNAYDWREPLTCDGIKKVCQLLEAEGFR